MKEEIITFWFGNESESQGIITWVHINVLRSFLFRNEFLLSFHGNQYLQPLSLQSNKELRLTFKLTIFKQEIWTWSVDYSLYPSNKTRFTQSAFIIFFASVWHFLLVLAFLLSMWCSKQKLLPCKQLSLPFLHLKLVKDGLLLSFVTRSTMAVSMWILWNKWGLPAPLWALTVPNCLKSYVKCFSEYRPLSFPKEQISTNQVDQIKSPGVDGWCRSLFVYSFMYASILSFLLSYIL